MPTPNLRPGWGWRPCKDGQTGYLDSPTGQTTREPVDLERAERIMETYASMKTVLVADHCLMVPPAMTGFYVREREDGRHEVCFAFEGETVFDDAEDARQAVEEYRQVVIEDDPLRCDERELYQRALNAWGHEAQVGMVQEECAEAIVAASKILRNWTKDTADAFCEELADVEIMVGQMRAWLGDAAIGLHKAKKLKRLREKLRRV